MIPAALLPHTAVLIQPAAGSDGYGDTSPDYGPGATRATIPARLTQTAARENNDNRDAQIGEWRIITNHLTITGADRIEWNGNTFEVVGPPALPADWTGHPHHAEAVLRVVTG